MLPSTGNFKEINCPFFDSGLCERPYCHFRHVKKDTSDVLQASTSVVNPVNPSLALGENKEILQKLVSDAVRKALQHSDLPTSLSRPSSSTSVENVSQNLVTKVTEALVPPLAASTSTSTQKSYSASTSQQKVPLYKPTPIAVLKNRHIHIPYSPSWTQTCGILRKRSTSDDSTIVQKKFRNQRNLEEGFKTTTATTTTTTTTATSISPAVPAVVEKVPEPPNTSFADTGSVCNVSASFYSPLPVGDWKDNGFKYTPSSIETLTENTYVPSSRCLSQQSLAEYEPSEKSESAVEPTYEPLATNGSTIGEASYEPSRVSNSEPEYQPLSCDKPAKEYVPTDISELGNITNDDDDVDELDISPEIDLLHDLLKAELLDSDSDESYKKKVDFADTHDSSSNYEIYSKKSNNDSKSSIFIKLKNNNEKRNSGSGYEVCSKQSDSDSKSSTVVKSKNDSEKHKSDGIKKKSETVKRKGDDKKSNDRKRVEIDKKSEEKKHSDPNKKSDNSKKKSESDRKHSVLSNNSNNSVKRRAESDRKKDEIDKRKTEFERRKGDSDKKKSESRRKSVHSESDRKRNETDKKALSEKKHSEHNRKRSESDKKHEMKKKKRENEMKKSISSKDSSNERNSSSSHNSKHNEKNSSTNSDTKGSEKNLCVKSAHSEHKHSSSKSTNEKKGDENRKHSHKKTALGHSSSNSSHDKNSEDKVAKGEEYSKSKTFSLKRKRSNSMDTLDNKIKAATKHTKSLNSKQYSNLSCEEVNYCQSVSDSDGSDVADILDKVTLPNEAWSSTSDEETITKECYRIFQEYDPSNVSKKPEPVYEPPTPEEPAALGKRRVAHEGAQNTILLKTCKRSAPNPSQVLSDRFQKVKDSHSKVLTQTQVLLQSQSQSQSQLQPQPHTEAQISHHTLIPLGSPPSMSHRIRDASPPMSQLNSAANIPGARKRIAHVPNVSVLLHAKLKMQQKLKEAQVTHDPASKLVGVTTKAQTVSKGGQRVAHTPSEQVLMRPIVKDAGGKIPCNVRQNYLNILVDEYLKISPSRQEAFEKAEEEEKAIYSRSTTRAVYASHVSNTINRLRKAAHSNNASTSGKVEGKLVNRTVSHTSMLAGKVGSKGSWSIEKPRKPPANVINRSLYESLSHFIMTEEQLCQNGFPMSHADEKGAAVIHNFYKKPFVPKTPQQRMCARCSRIYYVNQQGRAVKEELCVYHWGRLFQSKTRGGWEARYNCCQGHGEAIGCSVGSCHVSDNFDPNNLRGFVKTLPKEKPPPDGDYGVYALDCEMCYTTIGLELTRVTVIGSDLKVVYETLVKPESTILDYNTRFSGIKEEDMASVTTNIYEVQSVLLSFISDKTILIGHSLESDFKALKLIHTTVVDTSVVYPHKMGPPKKRALKTLCRDLLQKIIQENEGGHDSAEDARAAMEIMLFKVKEDMKTAW